MLRISIYISLRRFNHLKWIICIESQQFVIQLLTETQGKMIIFIIYYSVID